MADTDTIGEIYIMNNMPILHTNLGNDDFTKKNYIPVAYEEYTIKETDMRIKTATFTTHEAIDLTMGVRYVKIISRFHETFSGILLDYDYDEKKGVYKYQCQDFSRTYMGVKYFRQPAKSKTKISLYNLIRNCLAKGNVSYKDFTGSKKQYDKILKEFGVLWSGMRDAELYNQKYYKGNTYKGNPFLNQPALTATGSWIEIIRNLVFSQLGFYDVWFNENGILQVEPLARTDWESTGLNLNDDAYYDMKFKFSTTNAIAEGLGADESTGTFVSRNTMNNLYLPAFFGHVGTYIESNSNTNSKNNNKTNTANNKNASYIKNKKIWIGADGGSGDFCQEIISELKKQGWTCHYSGCGANVHYTDYSAVSGDYDVLAIVDNGFCCTTIKEAYVNFCKQGTPNLKRNGVRVMFMFDTRDWLDRNKPYRYGDFNYHVFKTAYDDPTGYCSSMNSTAFFKEWNATYCCHPTAKGIVDQFLSGGICK